MKENHLEKNRAWIEIDGNHLENNINELKKIIPQNVKIMAVVKANAYGHGLLLIAKKLSEIGIADFAVATLEEGIYLRQHHIKGNILILGFTQFHDLEYVIKYDLIQTIVDYDYSEKIRKLDLSEKLKCHIKIDTGMNRLGEKYSHLDRLYKIYENEKLNILGTFSHLCVADSSEKEDIVFTKNQIFRFDNCVRAIKEKGYDTGKLHLQSSYGVINYKGLHYDYVRVGILMYGINSSAQSYQLTRLNLKPVLSLKARVTSIHSIDRNESVSYGRTYIATEHRKIASVSIGYADGIPRNLSNKNMNVKIKGNYCHVIGRICMDQLLIDISDISNVKVGDEVTFIGEEKEIAATEVADKAGTITNELLSRLGSRLERIVIEKSKSSISGKTK